MIFPLAGIFLGALIGAWRAKALGGKRADLVQWAAVLGLMGGVIGLFVLVFIERSAI